MHEKQLLIVEDAPLIAQLIHTMLGELPRLDHIRTSGSYAEAVDTLDRDHPDIVLLDINLPDRNGLDLLRYIKQHHPATTVIMCSNQSSPFYRNLCSRLGAAWFIDKSTEFENIPAIVAQFL